MNRISKGTEGIMVNNHKTPYIPFPINEDRAVLFKALAVNNGIVTATKVWDNNNSKRMFFIYNASGSNLAPNSYIVAYRCGEYNSSGSTEPELRTEDENNYSWIYLGFVSDVFVKDKGNNQGVSGQYNSDMSFTELTKDPKPLYATDPYDRYYNNPPFAEGRIYFGQAARDGYLVWLPGFGNKEKEITANVDGTDVYIDVDSQGNVLDLRSEGVVYDFWHINVSNWWFDRRFVENLQITDRKIYIIYLNQPGEDLGYTIDHKEVEIYYPDYSTKISTIKTSGYDYWNKEDYPKKWSWDWYKETGLLPSDVYSTWLTRSEEIDTANYVGGYPGDGAYPPTGSLNDSDSVLYRVKEIYDDGTSRITQKDTNETGSFYIFNDPSKYKGLSPAFIASADSTNYAFGFTGALTDGVYIAGDVACVPPEMDEYRIYGYQSADGVGGAPPYTLVTGYTIGTWEDYIGNIGGATIQGAVRCNLASGDMGWQTGNRKAYIILVYYKDGCESWGGMVGITGNPADI